MVWVVLALLVAALVALGLENQRAGELEGRVRSLESELAATRADLAAHRTHLGAIRDAVSALSELAGREPAPATPEVSPEP